MVCGSGNIVGVAVMGGLLLLLFDGGSPSAFGQTNLVARRGFDYPRLTNVGETTRNLTAGRTISRIGWGVGGGGGAWHVAVGLILDTSAVYPQLRRNQRLDLNGPAGLHLAGCRLAASHEYKVPGTSVSLSRRQPRGLGRCCDASFGRCVPGAARRDQLPPTQFWETTFKSP